MKNQCHPKYQRNYFWISDLNFFVASWGLSGSFLGFLGTWYVICIITRNHTLTGSPKKLPGSPQEGSKISGQKFRNNLVGILEETIILKITDLQYDVVNLDYTNTYVIFGITNIKPQQKIPQQNFHFSKTCFCYYCNTPRQFY